MVFPSLLNVKNFDFDSNISLNSLLVQDSIKISNLINIVDNNNLNICNNPWICSNLDNTLRIFIEGNHLDCYNVPKILEGCGLEPPRCPSGFITLNSTNSILAYNESYSTCQIIPNGLTVDIKLDSIGVEPILDSLRKVWFLKVNEYYNQEEFTLLNLVEVEYSVEFTSSQYLKKINLPKIIKLNDLRVRYNQNITDLNWIPNVELQVLDIQYNPSLKSVSFEHDYPITRFLRVNNNIEVEDIGNKNWSFEISELAISNNNMLSDISNLENVPTFSSLYLTNNPNLSDCNIPPICEGLQNSQWYTIENNGNNCESNNAVNFLCGNPTALEEISFIKVNVFPNPTNSWLMIDCKNANFLSAEVISMEGKRMLTSTTQEIDSNILIKGMYFLKINTDVGSKIVKFIKL